MKLIKLLFLILFLSLGLISNINSQQQSEKGGKLWGLVFGDYFFKISGDSTSNSTQYSSYSNSFQSFELRRVYLGYDYTFNEKFSGQILLESNDKIFTNAKYGIFIKAAYGQWNAFQNVSFAIGILPAPTWSWALNEKFWNYRSVEKTLIDMRGFGNGSDLGIAAKGKFDKAGNYGFNIMIGNGTGQRPDFNKYKKYYANFFAKPVRGLQLEVYGDYEPAAGDKNIITFRGFAGYTFEKFNFGIESVQQIRKNAAAKDIDIVPFGISAYVWGNLLGKQNKDILNAFARYDFYNPNTKNDSLGNNENFITAGLDYMPIDNFHLIPNIWINSYSSKSSSANKPKTDIVARMTFFFVFK
jgi:hypothetical protein